MKDIVMEQIKKNFGFGCMRLPMRDTGGGKAKASECIKCGKCEKACPQHPIFGNCWKM